MERIVATFTPHLTQFVNMHEVITYLDGLVSCRPKTSGRVNLILSVPGNLVPVDSPFSFEPPLDDRLFGKPPLYHFLKYLSPSKLLMVFMAMVLERRIIVYSNHVDRLTHFMFGLTALLYPLEWPHPFTPLLCERGLGYCAATVPFLFGVHASLLPLVLQQSLESITWVNLDSGSVTNPEDDVQHLRPQSVANRLSAAIETERNKISKKSYKSAGDALWNPFLAFWTALLVPCLKSMKSPDFLFESADSLKLCESSIRGILDKLMLSQLFQQYIDERQHRLKSGIAPTSEFDICAAKLSAVHSQSTLQTYFDSIAQHGLGAIASTLVAMPTTPAPIPRAVSPPLAIFSNALSESTGSAEALEGESRTLPPRPRLNTRPTTVSASAGNEKNWENMRHPILLSTSQSSSCAPSSTSSLESAPPSYGSDAIAGGIDSISPSPITPTATAAFSPSKYHNSNRNSDRLATARLHDVRKPWEGKSGSFSGTASSPSVPSSPGGHAGVLGSTTPKGGVDSTGSTPTAGNAISFQDPCEPAACDDWSSPAAVRADILVPKLSETTIAPLPTTSSAPSSGTLRPVSPSSQAPIQPTSPSKSMPAHPTAASMPRSSSKPNFASNNPFANPTMYNTAPSEELMFTPSRYESDFDTSSTS